MIITIDGPAGSGKSTIAKMIAKELGFTYIDTGAMYRAVALKIKRKGIDPDDIRSVLKTLKETDIDLRPSENGVRVLLDGEDVSDLIRTEEIGKIASKIARYPEVRKILVQMQRSLGEKAKNAVLEGRDTGTVIFPDAEIKFFFTASPEVRAERRYKELKEKGINVSYVDILKEIKERDFLDETRKDSPLKPADDAIVIDTTGKSLSQVFQEVLQIIKEKTELQQKNI
ncbi:cytidylate kinase [Persephonella hydrogeniphila]|uniref:Cytidylate kinase n=1 Tax=Persephonella hydrogeniphila TaxID=198703 RepID=A0A285NCB8_9AQUI|nr:(d)CMP kinase [Persephonella hydrogeniphila]SNZ07154.1 cytidylate kinase [Persephonella hydrogeniphila]